MKVERFFEAMKAEIKNNEHKGDWTRFTDTKNCLLELEWHKAKLWYAVMKGDKDNVLEYAADVANCAMFIANSEGLLGI